MLCRYITDQLFGESQEKHPMIRSEGLNNNNVGGTKEAVNQIGVGNQESQLFGMKGVRMMKESRIRVMG